MEKTNGNRTARISKGTYLLAWERFLTVALLSGMLSLLRC
jgi:hypothetical protein